jgi:hypothetical protein
VNLEILYDALLDKDGEGPSIKSKPQIGKFGFDAVCKGRTGRGLNISHNKFMVLTDTNGKPQAVWTGSTNFTDSGIYGQSNVGHAIVDAGLAQVYLDWHRAIWNAPDTSAADSRRIVTKLTTVPGANFSGTMLVLSPRKTHRSGDGMRALGVNGETHGLFHGAVRLARRPRKSPRRCAWARIRTAEQG